MMSLLFSLVHATTAATFPIPYDWAAPPVAWFGGNATNYENASQLASLGRYSMAIFGWQHLIFATNWTASIYAQLSQAALLKARHRLLRGKAEGTSEEKMLRPLIGHGRTGKGVSR